MELSFLADRYKQMQSAIKSRNLFKQRLVADYSFAKSLIFAKVNLPKDEFKLFNTMFQMMAAQLPQPEVIAILDPGRSKQEAQIVQRGREYEQNLPEGYLDRVAKDTKLITDITGARGCCGSTLLRWTLWPTLSNCPVARCHFDAAETGRASLRGASLTSRHGPFAKRPGGHCGVARFGRFGVGGGVAFLCQSERLGVGNRGCRTGAGLCRPLAAISIWGEKDPPLVLWLIFGSVWLTVMGFWGLEEWKGWPLRGYLVREHDVVYRSGWWSRTVTAVPFSRIQHSEIQQGPLGRWLGHCTLKLYTAGASGPTWKSQD